MKTAILPAASPVAAFMRAILGSAALITALAGGNLFGAPVETTLGGGTSGPGYLDDAQSLYALFHTPIGIAVDQYADNLYIADRDNNAIRDVDLVGGDTYTYVTNQINHPVGVALDGAGDLYVLNRGSSATGFSTNGTVLEFDPYGDLVATNASHLTNAMAVALDSGNNIYVTERTNLLIEITSSNQTTIATVTLSNALLSGVAVMPSGTLAVSDFNRDGIYTITTLGVVTTNAGFNGPGDGTGSNNRGVHNAQAQFLQPYGVAAAGDGTLIVADFGNDRVKVVTAAGITTNLYGVSSNNWIGSFPGWADGTVKEPEQPGGPAARCPAGVALSVDGSTVFTTEDYYHLIRETTGSAFQPMPPAAPSGPLGLTATVTTNGQGVVEVALTWNAVANEGVTNYLVERSYSSGSGYTIVASTSGTSFTDSSVTGGTTYYYIVQAANGGGLGQDSSQVSVTIPTPPPPSPTIGWVNYVFNGTIYVSQLEPVTGTYISQNDLNLAILPNTPTIQHPNFLAGPTPLSGSPTNGGSAAPTYQDGTPYGSVTPLLVTTVPDLTIEAVNINGVGEDSAVVTARVLFEAGNPSVIGTNAAQFQLFDVTTNVTYYYTTDGSNPLTNAPASQQVISSNGLPVTLSIDISTNFFFEVAAVHPGYSASAVITNVFLAQNFHANTLTWGFTQGECSSAFLAASGQTFYAPVTLTTLPGTTIYSMQFNMQVFNSGAGITNPGPATEIFNFNSMLEEPIPGTTPVVYEIIPPLMYAGLAQGIQPSQLVPYNGVDDFVNLTVSNGNELAVGWLERIEETNLYNTLAQTLITYSQAHDDLFPNAGQGEPNGVIVGGYGFKIPAAAVNGQQYQIQLGGASATSDGIGAPGSSIAIFCNGLTNSAALGAGSLNGIKNVTVASIPYLVGNAYPFRWFNAGDFGNSNLQNADLEQVFESAVYELNTPPSNSDFYDCMDSCGSLGYLDTNASDAFYGYYTNTYKNMSTAVRSAMYNGDYTLVNQMAFGDTNLDVSDVYLTFLRSEFTNNFVWFQRLWTNGVRVATAAYAPGIIPAVQQSGGGGNPIKGGLSTPSSAPVSITNTPFVNFTTTDFLASAGQTLNIPINANVFGPYPARMLLLNLSVVPLDSSPGITTPVSFTPNPILGTAIGSTAPIESAQLGNGNYSAAWMPTSFPATSAAGFSNLVNIGTLTVTIPTNATSMSSYAIHFDHASASPSGLISFPRRTITGLITLSARTNSYYGDGIPDSWRLRYFGTIYNQLSVSNANADGTCFNNWQKYLAGLDPMDSSSVLNEGADPAMAQSLLDHVIYWPSVNGQTYVIQRSVTLFPPQWTSISTNIGTGSYMEIHDAPGTGGCYRVTTQ